jgi:hypothetical protein
MVPLENAIVIEMVKNFLTIYETDRFITVPS